MLRPPLSPTQVRALLLCPESERLERTVLPLPVLDFSCARLSSEEVLVIRVFPAETGQASGRGRCVAKKTKKGKAHA